MKIVFNILETYETEFDYETGRDDSNESFDAACKAIREHPEDEIKRGKLLHRVVSQIREEAK